MGHFFSVRFCANQSNAGDFFPCLDSKLTSTWTDQLHSVFSEEPWQVKNSKFQLINTSVSYILLTHPAHRNISIKFKGKETSELQVLPSTGKSKCHLFHVWVIVWTLSQEQGTETRPHQNRYLDLQHYELKSHCRLRQIFFTIFFLIIIFKSFT